MVFRMSQLTVIQRVEVMKEQLAKAVQEALRQRATRSAS